jgi:REP-associated tyrosine transposase
MRMPRAKRHYVSGPNFAWHITHRCHKKEFLLRFKKDKRTWLKWLSRAKKAFRLPILDYVITSNHIHLLVMGGPSAAMAKTMHLVAGQTAQQFNRRKERLGAFWQDRYHSTAVDRGSYLRRCLVYIDLNMVRAGVVRHPSDWPFGGFAEMMSEKQRYRLVDEAVLLRILGMASPEQHRESRQEWVEAELKTTRLRRQPIWTESVAVGSKEFASGIKAKLGARGIGKKVEEEEGEGGTFCLKEDAARFEGKKACSKAEKA